MENTGQWLIWSIEHGAWWAPNECGYTPSRMLAGRYSFERAIEIVEGANRHRRMIPNEAMVLDTQVMPVPSKTGEIKVTRKIKE